MTGIRAEGEEIERDEEDVREEEGEETLGGMMIPPAPWTDQITIRGLLVSVVIGVIYSVIVMKLNLTTGLVPNLNVSAALISFAFLKTWTNLLLTTGLFPASASSPFTRQENTVVQTCAVACYSIALGGGFGSYLLGLSKKTYEQVGVATVGNTPGSFVEPAVGWMTAFLFLTSFVGLFVLVPLRKVMIIDYKLAYPSGTATAILINGFHTTKGDEIVKEQVHGFMKYCSISFLWGAFQWFYSGGDQCGFSQFPTFGIKARNNSFYFDFNATYIGAGMICPHIVNMSLLLGALISWGIMWPLIDEHKGQWFSASLPEASMLSLNGYKVFISISLILGDGLYNFLKILALTSYNMYVRLDGRNGCTFSRGEKHRDPCKDLKNEAFIRDHIPLWVACSGYVLLSAISIILIPVMFPLLKWYYVAVAYLLAPVLSFCNAYGAGLTDMNMAHNYGKVGLFVLSALAGGEGGSSVIAGLVGCGLIKSMVSVSSDLMHDLKTAHLTLTSPRSMLVGQAVGTAVGCVVAPLTFFLFYKAFDVGSPEGEYKAPYAIIYRNMAVLASRGASSLPRHCLQLCYAFFGLAVAMNMGRDGLPKKYVGWVPLPMAMAVPFLVGGYFAIDMCLGGLMVIGWEKMGGKKAGVMAPAIASGLICGDGIWIVPSAILALAKVRPWMCMRFSSV